MNNNKRLAISVVIAIFSGMFFMERISADETTHHTKLRQILRDFTKCLSSAQAFHVSISKETQVEPSERDYSMKSTWSLSVKRPNFVSLVQETGVTGISIICDGKTVYVYENPHHRYSLMPAPSTYASIFTREQLKKRPFVQLKTIILLDAMLSENAYRAITDQFDSTPELKTGLLDGRECDVVKLSGIEGDIVIWIDKSETPLLRKAIYIAKYSEEQLKNYQTQPPPTVSITMRFDNWDLNPKPDDQVFKISPPADATEVRLPKKQDSGRSRFPGGS